MKQETKLLKSVASPSAGRQAKSDSHLYSVGHLASNNIHLRNLYNMQRQRVLTEARNPSELPLMKELNILRRARSLRDPSTSPAWSNSSYGSRRLQGNIKEGRETKVGSKTRKESRKLDSKREKLDLRPGGHHWVGEFLGEEAADLQVMSSCPGSDQKENRVLKGNGLREGYQTVVDDRKPKSSKGTGKKGGRRLEKSRSYPRVGPAEEEEQQQQQDSQRKPTRSARDHQHLEAQDLVDGSILGERIAPEDDRLHRGSIRVVENSWVEEPERRAEIARRVISERSNGDVLIADSRVPSPVFTPSAAAVAAARARRDHLDLLSVINSTRLEGQEEEPNDFGDSEEEEEDDEDEEDEEDEEEEQEGQEEEEEGEVDIIGLKNGLKQVSSSLSSHTHSPLLYRDSLTFVINERNSPRGRRKSNKISGSKDGERRHREGINLRVAAKPQGRLRGRRAGLRSASSGGLSYGMEGELEVSNLPRNGCGIPWYWTRMHKYSGKRFLDIAGRSLGCGFTEGTKRKDATSSDLKQCRPNSIHGDFAQCDRHSFSISSHFGERSSNCEDPSHRFELHDGRASPEIPRADGNLLTADRSGELVFGSTRENLSGVLVPTSPGYGHESPGSPPSTRVDSGEPSASLSDKYRPRSFNELVGQSLVTKSLSTAVLKGKVAPLYLFQGPRGTGKSCTARIFAQALNCIANDVKIPRPCRFCTECTKSSPDVIEFDATTYVGAESVKSLVGSMFSTPATSRCRVVIIDDCDCLPTEAWNTFLKALDKAPWHVVFVLITTDAEKVPRTAISRCQKFLFSKIKESEVLHRLQSLAEMEGMEVEESALALVAARSQGSLRDAEIVLDQLSLLGKKVSLSMVQEMVGLVSDEKLIELLDLAMSSEAVSTVRCIRDLLDGGVEPLALVSQLATLITDVLAGTYEVSRERRNKGYFFRQSSKKEEAVRLRGALKILSEAEKQLRLSSDQPTWLTAALLQFAPDRSFQPSSLETSVVASPVQAFNDTSEKETGESAQPWTSEELTQPQLEIARGEVMPAREQRLSSLYREKRKKKGIVSSYAEAKVHPAESPVTNKFGSPEDRLSGRPSNAKSDTPLLPGNVDSPNQRDFTVMSHRKLEEVWQRVLHGSRSNVLRQLLQGQGKLLSLLVADGFAVAHLEFRHPEHKARAERSRSRICNAFQMALGCPVELQISLACMPGEQQSGFTSFDDHPQIIEGWQKEKAKIDIATPDRRSYDMKTVQNRRRQRGTRVQRHVENLDIPQSLYNAVMGDSTGFKPEILPVVNSTKWGRPGELEHSERPRETRTYAIPLPQEFRQLENARMRQGQPFGSRTNRSKLPLRTAMHHFDVVSPSQANTTDVTCGSSGRKKSVKFGVNNGHSPSLERENLRLESRLNPSQPEYRLLCWRVKKLDEEKKRVQRRRRQRRVRLLLRIVPCAKSHARAQQQQPQSPKVY
ncbi:unnamed protein product [Calypogeia fissa]